MPDFSTLTDRQREIYDFIREKIENRGLRSDGARDRSGLRHQVANGVMCHLKALEKKGLIIREGFSARAIQLVDHRPPGAELPLMGLVAAGQPLAAVQQEERLNFSDLFGGENSLRAEGQGPVDDRGPHRRRRLRRDPQARERRERRSASWP